MQKLTEEKAKKAKGLELDELCFEWLGNPNHAWAKEGRYVPPYSSELEYAGLLLEKMRGEVR